MGAKGSVRYVVAPTHAVTVPSLEEGQATTATFIGIYTCSGSACRFNLSYAVIEQSEELRRTASNACLAGSATAT